MVNQTDILCIGSVLWDMIGRCPRPMAKGDDKPGRITRLPGGVALNIAVALAGFGLRPALLSVVGRDSDGDALIDACSERGLETAHIWRSADLPTDRYMAIEDTNGLIAAIADAHSLEAAGDRILEPLSDGTLGRPEAPYSGLVALDGNLTEDLLASIAGSDAFGQADLRVAPASPGKAQRLRPFLGHGHAVLYVNLEEAGLLCGASFDTARAAALALVAQGGARVLVTNGGAEAACAWPGEIRTATPPQVRLARVTGAGDTFMAAHIAAESRGANPQDALEQALRAAATFVSGETPK